MTYSSVLVVPFVRMPESIDRQVICHPALNGNRNGVHLQVLLTSAAFVMGLIALPRISNVRRRNTRRL